MMRAASACVLAAALTSAPALAAGGLDAAAGKALFKRNWVAAPSSTQSSDGLGPLYNARSCSGCHIDAGPAQIVSKNGRQELAGAVVRFGDANGAPDPYYGHQLQTGSVPGLTSEGVARFLPRLSYKLTGPPLAPGVRAAARVAPSLRGRAAFDDIPDEEILKNEDPDGRNGNGISGRANRVAEGIGRFGWKASQATLPHQIANAFALDIGLSSPLDPRPYGDCTPAQNECLAAPNGESRATDNREVSSAMLDLVAAYLAALPAPQAAASPAGQRMFEQSGCAACHVPSFKTRSGNTVKTFTDFLLHDMGPELDDGVAEPGVASSEWRTAPLIESYPRGITRRYTHNGSAATLREAIEKHGGEAAKSRQAFTELTDAEKKQLIEYVEQQ